MYTTRLIVVHLLSDAFVVSSNDCHSSYTFNFLHGDVSFDNNLSIFSARGCRWYLIVRFCIGVRWHEHRDNVLNLY